MIEPDPREPGCRFGPPARIRNDDDWMISIQHCSRPCCVLADEADVDAARQVRRCKVARIAGVEYLRANGMAPPVNRK